MTTSEPTAPLPAKDDPRRSLRRLGAAIPLAGWLFLVGTRAFALLGEALVAFAIVAVVPMGVAVAADESDDSVRAFAKRAATALAPLGLAAFLFPPGPTAAALAGAWLLATCVVALAGVRRAWKRRGGPIEEIAIDVGHLYLPVGGAWLFASRAGISPMGFREPIVLYTAAHFHFAGFAAPTIVGLVGRELGAGGALGPVARLFYRLAAVVVMAGVPLVAAGITLSHSLEMPSSVLLGSGMLVLAVFLWLAALRRLFVATAAPGTSARDVAIRRATSVLLFVAGIALLGSMGLAVAFTLTGSAGREGSPGLVSFDTMVTYHGVANAFGFAAASLAAFSLAPPATTKAA